MAIPSAVVTLCDMIDYARGALLADQVGEAVQPTTPLELLQAAARDDSLHLWSDAELTAFANRAVDEVAARTLCLSDDGTIDGTTRFELTALGDPEVALDSRLLQITRVTFNGDVLLPASIRHLDFRFPRWREDTAEPRGFVVDDQARTLRVQPIPTMDGTLRISAIHRPLTLLSNPNDVPEIPQHYRQDACLWMAHLAYLKNDADTALPGVSTTFSALFEQRFGPQRGAFALARGMQASTRGRARLHFF